MLSISVSDIKYFSAPSRVCGSSDIYSFSCILQIFTEELLLVMVFSISTKSAATFIGPEYFIHYSHRSKLW